MTAALALVLLAGCASLPTLPPVRLEPVASGFDRPVLVLDAGDGNLLVVEQGGLVRFAQNGTILLDFRNETAAGGERGLLGLALSPRARGIVFVSYTDLRGDSVLSRYRVADASEEPILRVHQPYPNHNGGNVAFGPDGYLYYGLGDGGSEGDPEGNGQDRDALLGSLLRLDVGGASGYAVPPDNPFGSEVWAKGLRNPWRFTFDRETGDLWMGDVGQDAWEEIDRQPRASKGGEDYGWNAWEGTHAFDPAARTFERVTMPVWEYSHREGCSVTGGYAYRGPAVPALRGTYLFGDYCSGKLWGLRASGGRWSAGLLLETRLAIASFGEDARGDVYVVDHGGKVLRVAEG